MAMTEPSQSFGPGAAPSGAAAALPPSETVRVWDPFVRLFHWSLVGLVAVSFATGDEFERMHIATGYGVAGLVVLRLVWGVFGSRHARFGDFVRGPRTTVAYVRAAFRGRAARHLGHNPAGAAMIVAILALLAGISLTGVLMTTDAFWGAKWVEEIHEALANSLAVLIALHVAGVVASSLAHGENLVRAMVTGRKRRS